MRAWGGVLPPPQATGRTTNLSVLIRVRRNNRSRAMTHIWKHGARRWQIVSVLAIMLAMTFSNHTAFAGRLTDTAYQPGRVDPKVTTVDKPAQVGAAQINGRANIYQAAKD